MRRLFTIFTTMMLFSLRIPAQEIPAPFTIPVSPSDTTVMVNTEVQVYAVISTLPKMLLIPLLYGL